MKYRSVVSVLVVFFAMMVSACHGVRPGAGEEGVLIKKPWFFGDGGVVQEPVLTGLDWVWISTEDVIVNVQPKQYPLHFEDF